MSSKITKTRKMEISIRGTSEIMFDRYAGDNKTQLPVSQKVYSQNGFLVLPSLNVMSFLTAVNTNSAPKVLLDIRKYKEICSAMLANARVVEKYIPILKDGKPIREPQFGPDDKDPETGVYIERHVARLAKGVPNPKERPVIPTPWEMSWTMLFMPNDDFGEDMVRDLFTRGGIMVGFGTFRPLYGQFKVSSMVFSDVEIQY